MISIPNRRSIIEKIVDYKARYTMEHGHPPNVIYLDETEREDLRKACNIEGAWKWPVDIMGMELRKEEDFIIKTDRFNVI